VTPHTRYRGQPEKISPNITHIEICFFLSRYQELRFFGKQSMSQDSSDKEAQTKLLDNQNNEQTNDSLTEPSLRNFIFSNPKGKDETCVDAKETELKPSDENASMESKDTPLNGKKKRHVSWADIEGKGELMSVYVVPDYDRRNPNIKLISKQRLRQILEEDMDEDLERPSYSCYDFSRCSRSEIIVLSIVGAMGLLLFVVALLISLS
jgi:hypothetical protein